MKALFVYSNKYERCNDIYYSITQTAEVWEKRYLNIFSELVVLGRVVDVEKSIGKKISNTNGVEFKCTKLGVNSVEYFTKRKEIITFISSLVDEVDFVIARQSYFGAIAAECARKRNIPYVVEIVGSSWDSNWNYSLKGKIVAPYFELQAKRMVKNAKNVIYVTQKYLQKEYPTKGKTIGISNVEIDCIDDSILTKRLKRIEEHSENKYALCTVAAVDVKYKGQHYVMDAMRRLKKEGFEFTYYVIGGGSQERLKKIALSYGIENDVVFTGPIKKEEVLEYLDKTDIYIQPSLQEGLPRSMIEAMSRGALAIGYRTAGIPELVDDHYVCNQKSVAGICNIISNLTKEEMLKAAEKNFNEAKKYSFSILNGKREKFIKNAIQE